MSQKAPRHLELQKEVGEEGALFLWDEPLIKHTYYRIGGPADLLIVPRSAEALLKIQKALVADHATVWFLGLGSNVLISDQGLRGVGIRLTRLFREVEVREVQGDEILIDVGAGVANSTLLRRAALEGWEGLEFLAGVPGSLGGAVVMNAGTLLGEMGGLTEEVRALDFKNGGEKVWKKSELRFSYRKNHFLADTDLVTGATLRVKKAADATQVNDKIQNVLTHRKKSQPIDLPSCGSVFKNPGGPSGRGKEVVQAWQVVEKLGMRGFKIGGAQVSELHTNFIVNTGVALAQDVRDLIDLIKARAQRELGVVLEEEVKFLGEFKTS